RAVLLPGAAALTGTLTVGELSAASVVDEVAALGAPGAADPGGRLVTRDHVRPEWREGRLVLTVTPAVGGSLVPFEAPDPTRAARTTHEKAPRVSEGLSLSVRRQGLEPRTR
ncbi:MAG TPA: hypothetical protein VFG16_17705, partial [Streptomyces sp.]|nr:hypothetical protein [Streptomyces sp.]